MVLEGIVSRFLLVTGHKNILSCLKNHTAWVNYLRGIHNLGPKELDKSRSANANQKTLSGGAHFLLELSPSEFTFPMHTSTMSAILDLHRLDLNLCFFK